MTNSSPHHTALVWLRRDLRLADNPALAHACAHAGRVIAAYIHEPGTEQGRWAEGAASRWWLHRSLASLQKSVAKIGGRLLIRRGAAGPALDRLTGETGATLVTWNRLYEPAAVARDSALKTALRARGITVESFNGALLLEPWTVQTGGGTPYRVFTPFYRACLPRVLASAAPLPAPKRLGAPPRGCASDTLDSLDLNPTIAWDRGLQQTWQPGEAGAHEQLARFAGQWLNKYSEERNRPDHEGTSRLSPHLHFGEISARQIVRHLSRRGSVALAYIRQILWREFAHHLLFHFPHTAEEPLDPKFNAFEWRRDAAALRAWKRGRTGYPIVDAGMRELWHTGWMHNRIRMCVASFLTKNLRIHWLEGARWFWDTLVDADLANNTLGWQWVAGCGADAAPYYRIFNPVLQAEKFDPDRAYIRRWVPELAALPARWIHRPWEAPGEVLSKAGIKRGTYPAPVVGLVVSREAALAGYQKMKEAADGA